MRSIVPIKLEIGRYTDPKTAGPWASTSADGFSGAFTFSPKFGVFLKIVSSVGDETIPWEHVSVSLKDRTPTWEEMCLVKDLFWRPDECVVQFHPPEAEYVNHHPFTLHLWKPIGIEIPRPPSIAVGPK